MDSAAPGGAIEPLDGQRMAFDARRIGRQAQNICNTNQPDCGNLDADRPRQFQHDVLVFGDGGELRGGKFDDPRAADPVRRDRQTAGSLRHGGELQLYACQRETQDALLLRILVMMIVIMVKLIVIVTARVHRLDRDRAGNISAEHGHEIELPFGLHARLLCEIGPQVSFGQQVREERRQTAPYRADGRHQPARLSFIGEAQGRTVRIVNVVLLEGEDVAVARQPVDDPDPASRR